MGTIIQDSNGELLRPADMSSDAQTGETYLTAEIPPGEEFRDYIYSGGNLVKRTTLNTVANLKIDAENAHNFLNSLSERLEGAEARLWRSEIVAIAHDIVSQLHYGF